MASHVSDTERAIFWTKWRFQQCYRNTGNSENLGIIYKNTTVKKKLIILGTISVFILFFLKTRLQRKPDKSTLTLETLVEDYSFDDDPEKDFKNKINVNEQQDRIRAEKFEANDFVGGFGDKKLANEIEENNGFGEDTDQDGQMKNAAPMVPVLQPPSDIKDKVDDSFEIKLNDQVPMPEIKVKNDTRTKEDNNRESNLDQKKKIQDINEVDQKLKAGEKKNKKKKPETVKEKNPESNTSKKKKIQDINEVDQELKTDKKKNKKKKPIKERKLKNGKKKDEKKTDKESVANNDTIIEKDSDIEKKGVKHRQDTKIDSQLSNESIETTKEIIQSLASIASYMNGTEKETELLKANVVDDEMETNGNLSSIMEDIVHDKSSESQDKHKSTKKKKKTVKKTKLKSNKDLEKEEDVESEPKTIEEVGHSGTKKKKPKKENKRKEGKY